ncbi:MAG TPA: LysR family transcriptional regulator [Gelria sp.]|nr:LysR family transcriptional regulator [Gelria sp.]
MNLNLFKTYVRVVETQNLSKTAKEFGLSQPAVTKQIQNLEDTYGVLLLERSGRRLKTTEAGETLYDCARDIIKAMEKTERAMEEASESRRGNLSLGASNIPGEYILPQLIKRFKEKYPHISISIDIADTEKIYSRLAERELDIGIVGGWIKNRKIEGFEWLEDELVVIMPEHHKLARSGEINLESIVNDKWIFREKGSGTRKAAEDLLAAHGIKKEDLNVSIEVGSTEAVLASVEAGMGVSIVSHWAVKKDRKIYSARISNPLVKRNFYVVYPRQKTRRKSVNNFLDYVKKIGESGKGGSFNI